MHDGDDDDMSEDLYIYICNSLQGFPTQADRDHMLRFEDLTRPYTEDWHGLCGGLSHGRHSYSDVI